MVLEERYAHGRLHGPRRRWHRNGQLAEEQLYRHGFLHGLCRQWNDAGKLLGSFRMEHGTGLQKGWHDNGRLQTEFFTCDGQFCGRSRTWLRDGTLISEGVRLFNRNVPPDEYRRAATADVRLPKLRGRIGKSPVHNRALEQHIYRVFVAGLLQKRQRAEARVWLTADDSRHRTLGRFQPAAATSFVKELYEAGAVKVIAPDIYSNKKGDQFADCLLVKMPAKKLQRTAIRMVGAKFLTRGLGAVQPDRDWGESHLYISLG